MNSSHQYSVRLPVIGAVVLFLAPLVVFAETRGRHYTPAELFEQSTLVIKGTVAEIEMVDQRPVAFPTQATVAQVLKGSWRPKEIGFSHKHPDRNVIFEQEFNQPAKGQQGAFYLQEQNGRLVLIGYIKETEPPAQDGQEAIYKKAKTRSDLILDCTVVQESPLGHGASIQKSYQVQYKALYWAVVGLDLPDTIWIHYDSQEYPRELRSGLEAHKHKGERFIAFVDWQPEKKGWEFRLVRADEPAKAAEINRELKLPALPVANPAAVFDSLVTQISALATNHAELAGFPDYAGHRDSKLKIAYQHNLNSVLKRHPTPVLTKRRLRPTDLGDQGIFLQFILDDGTNPLQAPIDTVTDYPNLKHTLYAELILWEQAAPELKRKLEDILSKHKALLAELDQQAADKPRTSR
jgi:hypothetical protein